MSLLRPPYTGNPDLDAYLAQLEFAVLSNNALTAPIYSGIGTVNAYAYRYVHVRYADDNVGTGISNSPTGKLFLGLFNSPLATESTNPADYTWLEVSGGFGATKKFFYLVVEGKRLDYVIQEAAPSPSFVEDSGAAIDLLALTSSATVPRIAFAKSELPSLSNNPVTVQTFGPDSYPEDNTWGGNEVWVESPPSVLASETVFRIDGEYNPATNATTWRSPFLAGLTVGSLSAINANIGTITAGSLSAVDLSVGSNPERVGSSMTGTGARFYADGDFAIGNSAKNLTWDGSTLTLNGDLVANGNIQNDAVSALKIQNGAVTSIKILDAAITTAKIQDAAINNAKIGNAEVSTLKIQGNAVTVPVSAFADSNVTAGLADVTLQTVNYFASGEPVFILGTTVGTAPGTDDGSTAGLAIQLRRNGTVLASAGGVIRRSTSGYAVLSFSDTPPPGLNTYTMVASASVPNRVEYTARSLIAIGTKR